ncbi:MAG TPA: ribonuclease HIII [Pyrinomonadaceae bacterium]|jgi:ribonuclease HIII
MNPKLKSLADKLNALRLRAVASQDSAQLINEIYRGIFNADFYQEIWDEPVLLAIQDLIAQHPPARFASQLQSISNRIEQVVAINDLFAALLLRSTEELPGSVARCAERLGVGQELVLIQTDGTLVSIRRSNLQPLAKLAAAFEALSQQVPSISDSLKGCFEAVIARQEIGAVPGLLVTQQGRVGAVLSVRTVLQEGSGDVRAGVAAQDTFSSAVQRGREALLNSGWLNANHDVIFTIDNTNATYSGSSIALAAAMAMYSHARKWQFDPYTAFTGDIDSRDGQWHVVGVKGIREKLIAARRSGIRRVVLPRENKTDIPEDCHGLDLILVDTVREVLDNLLLPQDSLPADTPQRRKVNLVKTQCSAKGWQVSAERELQHGLQLTITPATGGELTISFYNSGAHQPKQDRRPEFEGLLQQLNKLDSSDTPLQSVQQPPFTIKDATLRQRIKEQFEALRPSQTKTEQYCDYSFVFENGKEKLIVKQYSSGKLQLQGYAGPLYRQALDIITTKYNLQHPSARLEVDDYLASEKAEATPDHTASVEQVAVTWPHIGTDESGKGDYFGPLVIVGVWADKSLASSLAEIGVRDSKKLSDAQCQKLAPRIRALCQGKYHPVEISPERYNQLYDQFMRENKNLNHLLAWGHARAIEDLLRRQSCDQAIADQFGDEKYIASKLMEKGRTINLLQTPKGERFIAVAAASVLARDHFLSRLKQLSQEAGLTLPKGASPAVIEAAKQIAQKHGADALRKFAKLHFKTTASVLGEK